MKPDDAEEYTQALGQVVAGGWRQIALGQRLGVPAALGLTIEEWVKQRLGGYIKYAIPDRRQAVLEAYAELPSTPKLAAIFGVSDETIRQDLIASKNLEEGPPSNPGIRPPNSKNLEQPTSEQWADLAEASERAQEIEQLRTEQPERFAADEIFETLTYAVEQSEIWTRNLNSEWPGSKSPSDWAQLLSRLVLVTDSVVRRVHEGIKGETYAEQ